MLSDQDIRTLREMAAVFRRDAAVRHKPHEFKKAQVITSESSLFRVTLEVRPGGFAGDENGQATWQYNVFDSAGDLLESDIGFETGSRHEYKRQNLGEIGPATSGLAFYDSAGDLIIYHCNEDDLTEAC